MAVDDIVDSLYLKMWLLAFFIQNTVALHYAIWMTYIYWPSTNVNLVLCRAFPGFLFFYRIHAKFYSTLHYQIEKVRLFLVINNYFIGTLIFHQNMCKYHNEITMYSLSPYLLQISESEEFTTKQTPPPKIIRSNSDGDTHKIANNGHLQNGSVHVKFDEDDIVEEPTHHRPRNRKNSMG